MALRLYDLCGADDLRFSPYGTRAKMALALKGLDYETVPTRFTEISAIAGGGFKTVPVLEDRGTRVVDSFAIAEHLDEHYSGDPLFSGGPAGKAAARFVEGAMIPVHLAAMPLIAKSIHDRLDPVDQPYFRESREARLGGRLEEVCAEPEKRLADYRRVFAPLVHALSRSPYLGGDRPLFVDAIAFGSMTWLHRTSDLDWFGGDPVLTAWYERCRAIAAL